MPVYAMPVCTTLVYALHVSVIMSSGNDAVNDGEGDNGATIDLVLVNVDLIMPASPTESYVFDLTRQI